MIKNILIGIEAIFMTIITVINFALLGIIKLWTMFWYKILPKMPSDKPKWITTIANKLDKFYNTYLDF